MSKHRIKLRRGDFSSQRIEKYKNYGQLMERHRRSGQLRMGNYLIGFIILGSVVGLIYYALDRIEDFETPSSQPQESQEQVIQEVDPITDIKETPPNPVEGLSAYYQYVERELVYPPEAQAESIEGIVYVAFMVDVDGSISDLRVLKGLGYGCDEVALELVRNGPAWEASKRGDQPVKRPMVVPITFTLERAQEENEQQQDPR